MRCPECGAQSLEVAELTRTGKPAVLECSQCEFVEVLPGIGPDDVVWQPANEAAS